MTNFDRDAFIEKVIETTAPLRKIIGEPFVRRNLTGTRQTERDIIGEVRIAMSPSSNPNASAEIHLKSNLNDEYANAFNVENDVSPHSELIRAVAVVLSRIRKPTKRTFVAMSERATLLADYELELRKAISHADQPRTIDVAVKRIGRRMTDGDRVFLFGKQAETSGHGRVEIARLLEGVDLGANPLSAVIARDGNVASLIGSGLTSKTRDRLDEWSVIGL